LLATCGRNSAAVAAAAASFSIANPRIRCRIRSPCSLLSRGFVLCRYCGQKRIREGCMYIRAVFVPSLGMIAKGTSYVWKRRQDIVSLNEVSLNIITGFINPSIVRSCLRFRVGTHRSGMICTRVFKYWRLMISLIMFSGYLDQGHLIVASWFTYICGYEAMCLPVHLVMGENCLYTLWGGVRHY
jgi:hypothetical protein